MHLPTRRPALFLGGILAVAVSSCVVGDTGSGGTGGGAEPPNPVVLRPATAIAAIDTLDSVLAGDTLIAASRPRGGRAGYRQSFQVSNATIAPRDPVPHGSGNVTIEPSPANPSRVFYSAYEHGITSVDIASGEEVKYAGTETHWGIGVVGEALITRDSANQVFVTDLKSPQQRGMKIAEASAAQLSGDLLSVQAAPDSAAVDVYRIKSPLEVVKEGTIVLADGKHYLTRQEEIKLGGGGKVFSYRQLADGKEKVVAYAKQGTSFVEWYRNSDSSASEKVLAASGNLILMASWAGKLHEGSGTLTVVDVSQQGAPRELGRLPLEGAAQASEWSGRVTYVATSGRVVAVDARDTNAVKFVEIFSGGSGSGSIRASDSTVAFGVGPSRGGGTLVLTMSDVGASGGGTFYCGQVDPDCFAVLREVPNAFGNALIYEPQYPLFSDGALKRRTLYLPPGQKIDTSNPDRWVFPKGTSILKEFYKSPANPQVAPNPLEARLWVKTGDAPGPSAWTATVYTAASTGDWSPRDPANANYADVGGYKVPHAGVCVTCHQGTNDVVLGIDALQLSGGQRQVLVPDKPGATQPGATLERFNAVAFTQPVAATEIQGTAKAKAALGYLHSNCGSCHSDTGLAAGRTPRLRHVTTAKTPQQEPAYATLIAGGNVVPGSPATSNVFNRATTNMPPRFPATPQQTQDPAVGPALSAWILELAP